MSGRFGRLACDEWSPEAREAAAKVRGAKSSGPKLSLSANHPTGSGPKLSAHAGSHEEAEKHMGSICASHIPSIM